MYPDEKGYFSYISYAKKCEGIEISGKLLIHIVNDEFLRLFLF